MHNKENNRLKVLVESNFALINLKLKASSIQNGYQIQDSLEALMDFVGAKNLRFSNP